MPTQGPTKEVKYLKLRVGLKGIDISRRLRGSYFRTLSLPASNCNLKNLPSMKVSLKSRKSIGSLGGIRKKGNGGACGCRSMGNKMIDTGTCLF